MSDLDLLEGPLVGWIKGMEAGFSNERDALSRESFAAAGLDSGRLAYFRLYQEKYFNDRFVRGQGTEEILSNLERHGASGRWLDLGSGTTTLFWSIPLQGITSISCCDLVPEALAVLEELARSGKIPPCYQEALEMFGKPPSHLAEMSRRLDRFLVFDTLAPWPSWLAAKPFDLITAFGNFGIAPTPERYAACFGEIVRHLAPGGRAVGADWVRRPSFIAEDGHDNSYLAPALVALSGRQAGLTVLDCRQVAIAGDPQYDGVICWAMARPGGSPRTEI
jgi:SAM-dependent methyltransferase